jgi:hypothetical protein
MLYKYNNIIVKDNIEIYVFVEFKL